MCLKRRYFKVLFIDFEPISQREGNEQEREAASERTSNPNAPCLPCVITFSQLYHLVRLYSFVNEELELANTAAVR